MSAQISRLCCCFTLFCVAAVSQTLPKGWKVSPEGTRVSVGAFPTSSVVTPDGKYMVVLSSGSPGSLSVIDLAAGKETSRAPVADAWLGLAITKAGDKVYVGGGARAAVFEFALVNGALTAGRTFPLVAANARTAQDFAGDVQFAPDGHLLYVASVFRNAVVVINPQSGVVVSQIRIGRRPYRILFPPSGKTMYVSAWADGSIGQYDVNSGQQLTNTRVAPHATDMVWVDGAPARVFVPAANTNNVYVLGASDTGELTKIETINVAVAPDQPLGSTPSAVALSADKKRVYVACSDTNDVAVIDISGDRNRVSGFVPAGAYPTAMAGLADGRLAILNGHSNEVQVVDMDDAKLPGYSDTVLANIPYRDDAPDAAAPEGSPVRAGGPIHHVIYVVRGDDEQADWATAGIASDYFERLGNRWKNTTATPDPASLPPAGYLWNAASQAGLKVRNYGFAVHNLAKPTADGEQVDRVYDPTLTDSTDMEYRGPDAAYSDIARAKEFATELGEYAQVAEMPQLLLVRIGSDDAALAIMTDALAKSKYRGETAMIVVGSGAPRVVSPLAKNGADDSGFDTLSALRTVETILGLHPMTVFDAAAVPMFRAF